MRGRLVGRIDPSARSGLILSEVEGSILSDAERIDFPARSCYPLFQEAILMTTLIPATYEHGTFKPLMPVHLPEHLRVVLIISQAEDDLPTLPLTRLAEQSESLAFLNDPREDRYTLQDGEPC